MHIWLVYHMLFYYQRQGLKCIRLLWDQTQVQPKDKQLKQNGTNEREEKKQLIRSQSHIYSNERNVIASPRFFSIAHSFLLMPFTHQTMNNSTPTKNTVWIGCVCRWWRVIIQGNSMAFTKHTFHAHIIFCINSVWLHVSNKNPLNIAHASCTYGPPTK